MNDSPTCYFCVRLPNLPVQAERLARPVWESLLISSGQPGARVLAASDDLLEAGITEGMSLYRARRIAPLARVIPPDERLYRTHHETVEKVLRSFASRIEVHSLGTFLLDMSDVVDAMPGGSAAMAQTLHQAVREVVHLDIQIGIASGLFVAEQAATCAPLKGSVLVLPRDERTFLSHLPVGVLPNLPREFLRRMQLLGVHSLGDLSALPQAAAVRQFGKAMLTWHALARGLDPRPFCPTSPPLDMTHSRQLEDPVDNRFQLYRLLTDLSRSASQTLTAHGCEAEAIQLTLTSHRREVWKVERVVKPATADPDGLERRVRALLDQVKPTGAVTSVTLTCSPRRSEPSAAQLTLFGEASSDLEQRRRRFHTTTQALCQRLGAPPLIPLRDATAPAPIPAQVEATQNGIPTALYRDKRRTAVTAIEEHWRVENGWWDTPICRDYFRVVLANGAIRNLFHEINDASWFLDRTWSLL